ncbi:hypothetical protein SKAU_G00110480 [Synaphobranchus kaupii]|uniref:Uncharacterized protein n=1 Tax=Synaphobranchus kaupii TaxID=118154 RepID=A0A9Q1G159_SYNKA|nr:hypothetical protein SKAU_G00110480 [Synaphobranchus kaupii]
MPLPPLSSSLLRSPSPSRFPPICPATGRPSTPGGPVRPPSSLGSETQSTDTCPPQRRTSHGSLKEKTIRRKMRVYSPESPERRVSQQPRCGQRVPLPRTF